jgi:hypothetical protein
MRALATTICELAGMAAITAGVWQVSSAAGMVVGGAFLIAVGVLGARS